MDITSSKQTGNLEQYEEDEEEITAFNQKKKCEHATSQLSVADSPIHTCKQPAASISTGETVVLWGYTNSSQEILWDPATRFSKSLGTTATKTRLRGVIPRGNVLRG